MTSVELLALAKMTLAAVPHHSGITAELCAAICWVESSGDPDAVGDSGRAIGLAQFHLATWEAYGLGCRDHRETACGFRDCPCCSMIALVREMNEALEHEPTPAASTADHVLRRCARLHNAGRFDTRRTLYTDRVARALAHLILAANVPPVRAATVRERSGRPSPARRARP